MLAATPSSPASSYGSVRREGDDAAGDLDDTVRLHEILSPEHWVDKKERVACGDCGLKFSNLFRRRHHCRLCGDLFCKQCVVRKLLCIPRQDKVFVKICRACSMGEAGTASSSTASSAKSPRHHPHDANRITVTWRSLAQTAMSKSSPSLGTSHPLTRPAAGTSHLHAHPAPLRSSDTDRLAVLHGYNIDYTAAPSDQLVQLCNDAAAKLRCPIATVSFMEVDMQHIVASVGLTTRTAPRDTAWMCDAVVTTNRPVVVLDAMQDTRYRQCALVRRDHVRFYAGVPLANKNGWVLGTLAVMDTVPRECVDISPLVALAEAIIAHLRQDRTRARPTRTLSFDSADVVSLNGGVHPRPQESESLIMPLLANTTQTQVSLAQQHSVMASTLSNHSTKISQLVQAIARMETKLGGDSCDDNAYTT